MLRYLLSSELVSTGARRVGLMGRDRGGGDIDWRCICLFILPGF